MKLYGRSNALHASSNSRNLEIRKQVIATLNLLPDTDDIDVYGPMVLAAFKDVPFQVWQVIDNDLGNARPTCKLPHLVRRVRNSAKYGPMLFEVLS